MVERRPVTGREVSADALDEDEEIRIPVMEEEVEVQKRARVREEVSIGKRPVEETRNVSETVRREEARVESQGDVGIRPYAGRERRRGGQTLGMRPWRIRVSRDDGGTVGLQQAVIRVLVAAAPMLLLALEPAIGLRATLWTVLGAWALWFATALFDPRRRALHDLAADTELRRVD